MGKASLKKDAQKEIERAPWIRHAAPDQGGSPGCARPRAVSPEGTWATGGPGSSAQPAPTPHPEGWGSRSAAPLQAGGAPGSARLGGSRRTPRGPTLPQTLALLPSRPCLRWREFWPPWQGGCSPGVGRAVGVGQSRPLPASIPGLRAWCLGRRKTALLREGSRTKTHTY